MVWGAYLAIPAVLLFYMRKRPNVPFKHLFALFGTFILACGTTHFMGWLVTYNPIYRLDGVIKLFTGIVSWATVIALFYVTPRALSMVGTQAIREFDGQDEYAELISRLCEFDRLF